MEVQRAPIRNGEGPASIRALDPEEDRQNCTGLAGQGVGAAEEMGRHGP